MGRRPLPPEQRKPRLSGAQRRKQQYDVAEAAAAAMPRSKAKAGARKASASRHADTPAPSDEAAQPADDDAWAQEFLEAGPIDLGNPDTSRECVATHLGAASRD